jgi:hypothetical protein
MQGIRAASICFAGWLLVQFPSQAAASEMPGFDPRIYTCKLERSSSHLDPVTGADERTPGHNSPPCNFILVPFCLPCL